MKKDNGSFGKKDHVNPYSGRIGLVYARVSSKRKETEGSGLQSQEGRCIADLKRIGVKYGKSFLDSYSGGGDFMSRPAMREMIDFIDLNPHMRFMVIFDDISRLARDVFFHIKLRTEFRKRDVELRCLNYNFDESEEGEFAELIFAGKAELDRKQNRRQVIQKQKARLELGYWAFGSKKGYTMTKTSEHGMLSIPNREGLEILKIAIEGFADGTFVRKIDACDFLIKNGFWKRKYACAYIDKFALILKDPFYMGDIEYKTWGVARRKGKHEAIISEETYNRVQMRLGAKGLTKRIRRDTSEEFYLRGLVLCSACLYHLTGAWTRARGKLFPYYFCQNGDCEFCKKSIRKDVIEGQFKELLEKNKLKSEVGDLIQLVFDQVWKEEITNIKVQEKSVENRKNVLENKVNQLTNMICDARTDKVKKLLEDQLVRVADELEECDKPISDLDLSIPYQNALNKAVGLIKNPYSVWEKLPVTEKHQLFYFLFEGKLEYSKKEGYRNDKLPYAVRLFEDFATSNTQDVEMAVSKPRAYRNTKWFYNV